MLRILGTTFAALLGLAFGSFLNVCLSRWPEGESVVTPRSHCRTCGRTLAWWENVPLLSWLALRGRCRTCGERIHWRYPLVEAAVGALWAVLMWNSAALLDPETQSGALWINLAATLCGFYFLWLLVALAALDAEHLWLPDFLTLPGIAIGFLARTALGFAPSADPRTHLLGILGRNAVDVLAAAGIVVAIRWIYSVARRQEGIGFGDVKLMALLAAWLGFPNALLSFVIGVVVGALVAVSLLIGGKRRRSAAEWGLSKLPLGTFLCLGGMISALWGQDIITTYLRWAGF